MSVVKKTEEEFRAELKDQLYFLRSSSKAYDEGHTAEAKRLATTIYVLLFDGGRNTVSLCSHLNIIPSMKLISTAVQLSSFKDREYIPLASPLTTLRIHPTGYIDIAPSCHAGDGEHTFQKWLSISDWLNEQISNPGTEILTRRDLINSIRSQDGGSHVDSKLTNAGYVTMKRCANALNVTIKDGDKIVPLVGGPAASIRQIAWEVEHSITKFLKTDL